MKRSLCLLVVVFGLFVTTLSAQGKDAKMRFGVTFPDVGVIWNISNSIAVRPYVAFNKSTSTFTTGSTKTESSSNSVSPGVDLRFYIKEWNDVRFYLSPAYSFSRSDSSSAYSPGYTHNASGSWGIEYPIAKRVSVFGTMGGAYSYQKNSISAATEAKSHSWGLKGNWGLILYLK